MSRISLHQVTGYALSPTEAKDVEIGSVTDDLLEWTRSQFPGVRYRVELGGDTAQLLVTYENQELVCAEIKPLVRCSDGYDGRTDEYRSELESELPGGSADFLIYPSGLVGVFAGADLDRWSGPARRMTRRVVRQVAEGLGLPVSSDRESIEWNTGVKGSFFVLDIGYKEASLTLYLVETGWNPVVSLNLVEVNSYDIKKGSVIITLDVGEVQARLQITASHPARLTFGPKR